MQYFISNITYEALKEDDSFVSFTFDIVFTEPEPLTVRHTHLLSLLFTYIKQKDPGFYSYIESVQKSLDSWGPSQKELVEALGDEGIHLLYHYLEDYLLTCDWMSGFYNQQLSWHKQSVDEKIDHIEKAEEVVEELEPLAKEVFDESKRYRQFCSRVEKEAKRIAVEIYPELLDADTETIKKFGSGSV